MYFEVVAVEKREERGVRRRTWLFRFFYLGKCEEGEAQKGNEAVIYFLAGKRFGDCKVF